MELLPDELRRQLPPIREIHSDEGQCMIYVKLFTYSGVAFYVAEGEQRDADYLLWGLLVAPQFKFPSRFQILLSRLEGQIGSARHLASETKILNQLVGDLNT